MSSMETVYEQSWATDLPSVLAVLVCFNKAGKQLCMSYSQDGKSVLYVNN